MLCLVACGEKAASTDEQPILAFDAADIRLASHVTTFGQFRAGIPTEDPGSGHYAVSAGFRIVLR